MKDKKIYERKDGRFEIRYVYGLKENGNRNYKSLYGKTKEEVLSKYNQRIRKDILIFNKELLENDIYRWLKSAKIRCKKSTYSNYRYTVNARIIPRFAKLKKRSITSEIVDGYTAELLEEGLSPKTVKDIIIILHQILKFAGINIKISMPKVPKNEIQIFKVVDQIKLEKFLLKNMNTTSFGIYFCLYTGLRIGEVCALKWEDIDIENRKIKIKKTITRIKNEDANAKKKTTIIIDDPKSISSIREIHIPDFIIPVLKEIRKDSTTTNFLITGTNKFIETRTYLNKYKKILQKINLQEYNFHALRHTFATRCVENGCDPKTLSEILGHSSVKITLERYVHPNYENKVKMMNQIKPLYN